MKNDKHNPDRRRLGKALVYIAPAVVTMAVVPSFASAGSRRHQQDYFNEKKKPRRRKERE